MADYCPETEMEKLVEYASVKFLLKQVYAAHTTKVKELESEVKDLKKQLEEANRRAASAKSDCAKCREMELAYSACKEEYKNAVLEQTKRLKEFEQMFSCIERNKRLTEKTSTEGVNHVADSPKAFKATVEETMLESPVENLFSLDFEEAIEIPHNAPTIRCPSSEENIVTIASQTLMPPPFVKPHLVDPVFVPDTLEITPNTNSQDVPDSPKTLSTKKMKKINVVNLKKGKENKTDSEGGNRSNQVLNVSKKRALNEVILNEVQSKRQHSTECMETLISVEKINEPTTTPVSQHCTIVVETSGSVPDKKQKQMSGESSCGWADNFKDFKEEESVKSNSSSVIAVTKMHKIIDDDFVVKKQDENSSWKTSVKKNAVKKPSLPKAIRSTSRYKMTLDAPNPNPKRNYKQTKLPKSIFMPSNICDNNELLNNISIKNDKKNIEEIDLENCMEDNSSCASLSQLASLADFNSSYVPNHLKKDVLLDVVSEDSSMSQSETFCPLGPIAENKAAEEIVENLHASWNKSPLEAAEKVSLDDKSNTPNLDDKDEELGNDVAQTFSNSFDRLPVEEEPNYKYKEDAVRNKNKRKQLNAFNCKECEKYYTELGLSDEEKKERMKNCSRHRAKFVPPPTPEHFWELEFPDTEECKARGYVAETQKVQLKSRRRRPLNSE